MRLALRVAGVVLGLVDDLLWLCGATEAGQLQPLPLLPTSKGLIMLGVAAYVKVLCAHICARPRVGDGPHPLGPGVHARGGSAAAHLLMSDENEAEAEVSRWREPLTPPPIHPEDADPETRALLLHDTGGALLDRVGAP